MKPAFQITPTIYLVPGLRTSNAYVVLHEEDPVLIDTGLPGSEKKIADFIRSIGLKPERIRYILLTHPDIDHAGGLWGLKRNVAPDAIVAIHGIDAPRLAGEKKLKEVKGGMGVMLGLVGAFVRFHPIKADIVLDDKMQIAGLHTIFTPGHTQGSVCFYSAEEKALFVGDTLRTDSKGNVEYTSGSISFDSAQLIDSVKTKLTNLEYDFLLPGHGPPVTEKASEKVKRLATEI